MNQTQQSELSELFKFSDLRGLEGSIIKNCDKNKIYAL